MQGESGGDNGKTKRLYSMDRGFWKERERDGYDKDFTGRVKKLIKERL